MESNQTPSIKKLNQGTIGIINYIISKNLQVKCVYDKNYTKIIFNNRYWIIETIVDLENCKNDIKSIIKLSK